MSKRTNKTAPLLKLIAGKDDNGIENPIINKDFKDEVIHIRAKDSITETVEDNNTNITTKPDTSKVVGINIVSELVQEWINESISRFNICDCDVCRAEITLEALNTLPPKYVYINSKTDYNEVKKIKDKCRAEVIRELVKIAISRRNLPIHKQKK